MPYSVFDWCVTGNLVDCANLINNNFKDYFKIIMVKKSNGDFDLKKVKTLNNLHGGYTNNVYHVHMYYPSIIELHYDLTIKDDKNKMFRRINRLMELINLKKPILFVRVVIQSYKGHPGISLDFFNITYDNCLKNCFEFVKLIKYDNYKILLIHYNYVKSQNKDIINKNNSKYVDSVEIISNHGPKNYSDDILINKYIKPILENYNFENN